MEITKSMYLLAKRIVKEYESIDKPKKEKPVVEFSKEVHDCLTACLRHFPEALHPNTQLEIENWLDCIEKLNRLDKIPFEWIEFLVKSAREDDFWSTNFLSLLKLRKKNTSKVKYIQVFYEKFGKQPVNKKGASSSLIDKARKSLSGN